MKNRINCDGKWFYYKSWQKYGKILEIVTTFTIFRKMPIFLSDYLLVFLFKRYLELCA